MSTTSSLKQKHDNSVFRGVKKKKTNPTNYCQSTQPEKLVTNSVSDQAWEKSQSLASSLSVVSETFLQRKTHVNSNTDNR